MRGQNLLAARRYAKRPGRSRTCMVSCPCAQTRAAENTAWRDLADAGIGGSDEGGMMPQALEARCGGCRMPQPVEMLSGNGSPSVARKPEFSPASSV